MADTVTAFKPARNIYKLDDKEYVDLNRVEHMVARGPTLRLTMMSGVTITVNTADESSAVALLAQVQAKWAV